MIIDRYENKLTRVVWTFCIIAHCNWIRNWQYFQVFSFSNIWIQELKYSNIQMVQRSNIQIIQLEIQIEIQIFWYCTLTKFTLIPNLDKLTTQFDFDNALLSKKEHQWFRGIIFQLADDIYMTFSLNVCWLLKANVCFVLLGIVLSRPTSLLVGFDFYTNDFHSLNLSQ